MTNWRQYAHFETLPVGATFSYNGNGYRKKSSKTAAIVTPQEHAGVWFYFKKADLCIVGRHCLIA